MYTMPVKGSIVGEYNSDTRQIRVVTIRGETIAQVDLYSAIIVQIDRTSGFFGHFGYLGHLPFSV